MDAFCAAHQAGLLQDRVRKPVCPCACWTHMPSEPCTHGSLEGLPCIQVEPGFMSCPRDVEGLVFLLAPVPLWLHLRVET